MTELKSQVKTVEDEPDPQMPADSTEASVPRASEIAWGALCWQGSLLFRSSLLHCGRSVVVLELLCRYTAGDWHRHPLP